LEGVADAVDVLLSLLLGMLREGNALDPGLPPEMIAVGDDPLESPEAVEPVSPGPVPPDPGDEPLPPGDGPVPPGTSVGKTVSQPMPSLLDGADRVSDTEAVAVVWLDAIAVPEVDAVSLGPAEEVSLEARPA
jgi:hypothetical protein